MSIVYMVRADWSDYESGNTEIIRVYRDKVKAELERLHMEELAKILREAMEEYNRKMAEWEAENPRPDFSAVRYSRRGECQDAEFGERFREWGKAWREQGESISPLNRLEFVEVKDLVEYEFCVEEIELDEEV